MSKNIIEYVSKENKEWVSSLSNKEIAKILDAISLLPNIINNQPIKSSSLDKNPLMYSQVPALRGLQGEIDFENMCLNKLSSQFKIHNTAKKAKSGDFIIKWTSPDTGKIYSFLIDIKNYTSTIPSKEIDKFYRDINLQSSLSGAMLISLNSKIVGKKSTFEYEEKIFNMDCIPIAYISSNESNVICEIIKFMFKMCEIKHNCGVNFKNSEAIMDCIKDLELSINMFSRSRGCLQETKLVIEKQFNKIFMEMLSVEHIFKTKIQKITDELVKSLNNPVDYSNNIINKLTINFSYYKSSEDLDNMIRHIFINGKWEDEYIKDNDWILHKDSGKIKLLFKFAKSSSTFILYDVNMDDIKKINSNYPGKITKQGYKSKICKESYVILCKILDINI